MNDRMHSVECSGASQSSYTYIEITWDTPVIYMIILKITGKLLLPMCSDLMVQEAYTYPNGFSVSLSAFLPDDTGVAALILVTAVRPCHIHPPPLVPPSTPPEYPLLEVLFLKFTLLSRLYYNIVITAKDNPIVRCISHPICPPPATSPTTLLPIRAHHLRPRSFLSAARYHCQPYTVAIVRTRLQNGTLSATQQIQNLYKERKKPPYAKYKINTNECHKLRTPK